MQPVRTGFVARIKIVFAIWEKISPMMSFMSVRPAMSVCLLMTMSADSRCTNVSNHLKDMIGLNLNEVTGLCMKESSVCWKHFPIR
jgi:hypothetical protein